MRILYTGLCKKKLPKLSIKHILFGGVFLILFALFTLIAKLDLLTQFDFNTTVKLQNHIPQRLFFPLSLLSVLARFDVITVILLIYLFLKKNIKSLMVFFFFGIAHIVEYIGKMALDHPGPPFMFYKIKDAIYFPDLYVVGASYPSGHALRSVFIATLFTLSLLPIKKIIYKKIIIIFLLWMMVGSLIIGKIALGQHWTSDIIGGLLLGLSFGFIAKSIN